MCESENTKSLNESLRIELVELNKRSRWYAAQLWHIPFAYFGILGLTATQIGINKPFYLPVLLIAGGIFGFLVHKHMKGMLKGVKRSVGHLRVTEILLGLSTTAKYKPKYVKPLLDAVYIVMLACFVSAFGILVKIYFLYCSGLSPS